MKKEPITSNTKGYPTMNMLARIGVCLLITIASLFANINTGGQSGLTRTQSAQTLGKLKMKVGAGINYAQSADFFKWGSLDSVPDGVDSSLQENAKLLSGNFYWALGLTKMWDLAVSLPLYWDGTDNGPMSAGIGDLEISTKIVYPAPGKPRLFYQAYYLDVALGLANMQDKGIYPRHAYYYANESIGDIFTAAGPVVKGLMVWTFDIGNVVPKAPLRIHVNAGGAIPRSDRAISALVNMALEYYPTDIVSLYLESAAELRGSTVINDLENFRKDMLFITPGIKINSPAGVFVNIAADIGMSNQDARTKWLFKKSNNSYPYTIAPVPRWGVQFQVGWNGFLTAQDDDKDGIKNNDDRCPRDAEDMDGFEDADGCPDIDNDKDGIVDSLDKCQLQAEDMDGFQDSDGCPDPDNDKDGIIDERDQCPNVAEDFDGFEDRDGCPDFDNDKDGVADTLDRCPNDQEDLDKFEDADGCPDIDNDKDGIFDLKDKCPNAPETFNSFMDDDGCPDTVVKKESTMARQMTLAGVKFKSGTATLLPDSYVFIEPIIQELKNFPSIQLEIRGHMDSLGEMTKQLALSQARAEAVRQHMMAKGIEGTRLRAVGFGSSNPVADNRKAAGREQNRRIEIVRIQ